MLSSSCGSSIPDGPSSKFPTTCTRHHNSRKPLCVRWGVKVANVEVKQVDMPESMLRAMAKQAEAEREKRSKIIHAEGEFSAAQRLVDAAKLLATEPVSVQLRYLQTLTEIGVEKNTTVVVPVPVDFFSGMQKMFGNRGLG